MQNKTMKRIGAVVLAAILTFQCAGEGIAVNANPLIVVNDLGSDTQMSSEKEVVYVNTYSDVTERKQNFDDNWKFYLGDASGAEQKNFDDSRWENISVPHDYSIEQEFSESMEAESAYLPGGTGWYRKHFVIGEEFRGKELRIDFGGVYMNATVWVNGEQLGTHPYGYTPFSFNITDYVEYGRENVITVKVDHQTPSSRWYSGSGIYRSVNLTVTDAVHVDLYGTKITSPNLENEVGGTVHMTVDTTVVNAGEAAADVTLVHTIYEKGTDNSIGTVTTSASVAAGASNVISAELSAVNPRLWSVDSPNLYTVVTEVKVGGSTVDTYETEYGFRYFAFDNNTGFTLNGEAMKLKGVCMHHDQGSLGAEAHAAAIRRQMQMMKDMGANAIRVTHNPADDSLIEICNEIGLLVIEEAFDGWLDVKNGNSNDYSNWFDREIEDGNQILHGEDGMTWAEFDIKAMVRRGVNAPSIIMWSLGNEVQEGTGWQSTSTYPQVANDLIGWIEEIDTERPATNGDNALQNLSTQAMLGVDANIHAAGGVVGTNYSNNTEYDNIHNTYPEWSIYGSETASHVNSRGVYSTVASNSLDGNKALTSYDYSCVGWGATASDAWYDVITRDYVAGEFVWTGFDYLGEPTPANGTGSGAVGSWPSPKNSYFGIVDTAGLPKDNYYLYQSLWNEDVNTLHVLPAWNEDVVYTGDSRGVPVVVYSDAASVELKFISADGTEESLGIKEFTEKTTAAGYTYQIYEGDDKESQTHRNLYLTWYVPYEDGTIEAVAYDRSGNVIRNTVGRSSVTTTGDEAELEASVDRTVISADGKDLAYVTVNVTDSEGNIVPDASNQVTFDVEGDGVLVGVDNGRQADHQSYQDDNRAAYNGSLVAIIQSTKSAGSFTVTASADGLVSDSVVVRTEAVEDTTSGSQVSGFLMSKNYYVKVGSSLELPETIETRYTGDTPSEELEVVWETIAADATAEVGTFTVNGTVDGVYPVSVVVYVLDQLGGLLNYSTMTQVGVAPVLPDSRPAVAMDGEVLNASFPVAWESVPAEKYASPQTFEVEGTASVLGEEMTVTATVRVVAEQITIGDSISEQALTLNQDIAEDKQSDSLEAIKDGVTALGYNAGGDRTDAWSNYNNSQAGDNTAEITFEYATQQRIGEITIHFWKDGYSAEYPDAGTTEIYISETGADGEWTKVETNEILEDESENVKPYRYEFAPIAATFIKFVLTNSTADKSAGFATTGITEIEINKASGSYEIYRTAELESLVVNGVSVTDSEIASGNYYTLAATADVEAVGMDNAAVTVLPAYDGKIKIIVESEDHKERDTFVIYLESEKPVDPSDDSEDVPVDSMTASAGSEYTPGTANEGPASYVLDGNANTHWHTNWSTSEGSSVENRWIGVTLAEATEIAGVRCLPRTYGGTNGAVTEYKVEYKAEAEGEWQEVPNAAGTWSNTDSSWKYIDFEEDITAVAVRIVGVHTYADSGNDNHMSMAELRLRAAQETPEVPDVPETPDVPDTPTVEEFTDSATLIANATANSEQLPAGYTNDGGAAWAFDEEAHWWHSRYQDWDQKGDHEVGTTDTTAAGPGKPTADNPIWIQTGFDKVYYVDHITYQGRSNGMGVIENYELAVANLSDPTATPGDSDFTVVKSGVLDSTTAAQTIQLDEAVPATHIRLIAYSVHTAGGGDGHVAAQHIAIFGYDAPETPDVPEVPDVPEEGYSVSLSEDVAVRVGEDAQVTLSVSSEEESYNSYYYVINYDSDVLTYKSAIGADTVFDNNGILTVMGYGEEKSMTDMVTLTFTGKAPGNGDVTLVQANIDKAENANVQDAPAAAIEDATTNIRVGGYTVSLSGDFTGSGAVNDGEDYTFSAKNPYYNYQFTATMGGNPAAVINNGDGTFTIMNINGNLIINADKTPMGFEVTLEGNGKDDVSLSAETAVYMTDYTFQLEKAAGYNYQVAVTVDGDDYNAAIDSDGVTYRITGSDIIGAIVVTVTKTAASATTTQITFTGNGSADVVGDNPAIAVNDEDFTFEINEDERYDYVVQLTDPAEILSPDRNGVYTIDKDKLVGTELNVLITKTPNGENVIEVTEYVKLQNVQSMFLITVSGFASEGKVFAYDGNPMSYSEEYEAYAYLVISDATLDAVKTEAEERISELALEQLVIDYSGDINETGRIDINDVQLTYNMYNAYYSDFTIVSMDRFLRADMNHDKTLTVLDSVAIVEFLK